MSEWGTWQNELWVFGLAAAVPLLLAYVAWRHRGSTASSALVAMLVFQGAWTLGQGAELWANGLQAKLWLDGLQYIPLLGSGITTLVFALRYSQLRVPRSLLFGFSIAVLPPALVLLTAPLHGFGRLHAVVTEGDPFASLHYPFHALDLYLATAALIAQSTALVILVRYLGRTSRAYFRGTLFVTLGVLLPYVTMIASVAIGVRVLGQRDLSFICFGIGGGAIAWGLYRERVLSLVPVAREILFERVPDPVIVCDGQGRILDLNQAASSLAGSADSALVGVSLEIAFSADFDIKDLVAAEESRTVVLPARTGWRVLEGVWHEVLETQGGRLYLLRDVTERQRELDSTTRSLREEEQRRSSAEEDLRQAQKMDALGRLAGGVAHDFNNLLTVILANTEMALMDCQNEEHAELLEQTKVAAISAASLTQQLLVFGRKSVVSSQRVCLKNELAPVKTMLARLIRADIKIHFDVASDVVDAKFDVSQLQQLLVNLAVNARDAMPRGGDLRVQVQNVRKCAPHSLLVEEWVCLSVTDTGTGIAEADVPHIFEPFFTTKEVGKGTGLGLAMVYGSVAQHGGFVEVESRLGRGTTFYVYFRRASGEPMKGLPSVKGRANQGAPSGLVVLVEDHASLRKMVACMLQKFGFQVSSYSSPVELFACWDSLERPLILLSDVVMPGCSGIDLAERTQARWSGLPVLLMSGYSDDERLALRTNAGLPFISKPFNGPELRESILQALDDSNRAEKAAGVSLPSP